MSYTYLLAGEGLELAEAELKGFLASHGLEKNVERKNKLAFTESEPAQLKRLALTHEITELLSRTDTEEPEIEYRPENSYAVRAKDLTEMDRKEEVEEEIGGKISTKENSVDLERPEEVIKAYIFEDELIIGRLIEDIDRGLFEKRKNQKRPFSSPVSLDPVLARVLVNLSEVSAGESVLDPFCGTGGILIEAGLCGCGVAGTDVKEEMVKGTRKNLEEYGIIAHDIRESEVSEALEIFDTDVLITDLPYGKASKEEGSPVEDFVVLLEEFNGRTVFMWNKEELGGYKADFSVYVHRNLTRYIFIID
jgi:tRNA (guanine10-N2)-dimethyltransferase